MEPTEMVTGLSSTLLMSQINTDLRYDFFVAVLHFMQVIYFPLNICLNLNGMLLSMLACIMI